MEDEAELEAMLLEVQRLFPPFLGGRRVARQVIIRNKTPQIICRPGMNSVNTSSMERQEKVCELL